MSKRLRSKIVTYCLKIHTCRQYVQYLLLVVKTEFEVKYRMRDGEAETQRAGGPR